ncbi:PilN domain-containing protein [Aromatoleum bremense]|uniref:Fimbrial assembly protein n=1 Tax=Aromatoleum bremense TaxID=76115 RepID=A0ABX1NVY8_9RHOO|nr:PilN domain-containing protein [Aromatoleum bremense]NMG16183.1 fimbrial assembly protein [Aromatoleum bremense]QTQ32622.1 Uncharacterized protein pbN1_26330 [Aromatoleum bremense]
MALEAGNPSLFGFDLRRIGQVWRNGWNEAFQWPSLAWLTPQEAIRVLMPDGGEALRLGASATPAPAGAEAAALAVVLPEDSVLLREFRLPRLAGDELRQAVELEVLAVSPFPPDETVWGWRAEPAGAQVRVRLALAARSHVRTALAQEQARLAGAEPEIWAVADAPIVLQGYGEHGRLKRMHVARNRILLALAGAFVLMFALAVTPVLQARERVFDAQRQYAALETEVASLLGARNALAVGNERARALRAHLEQRQELPQLLELITQLLPDDAFLSRLEVQGRQVRIVGQAADAAQLMKILGAPSSPFRNVRAPSPISRAAGSNKENFVIEFVIPSEEKVQ